ncbi:hypothetical protein, partial [Plasmodium yoelii yoelii]
RHGQSDRGIEPRHLPERRAGGSAEPARRPVSNTRPARRQRQRRNPRRGARSARARTGDHTTLLRRQLHAEGRAGRFLLRSRFPAPLLRHGQHELWRAVRQRHLSARLEFVADRRTARTGGPRSGRRGHRRLVPDRHLRRGRCGGGHQRRPGLGRTRRPGLLASGRDPQLRRQLLFRQPGLHPARHRAGPVRAQAAERCLLWLHPHQRIERFPPLRLGQLLRSAPCRHLCRELHTEPLGRTDPEPGGGLHQIGLRGRPGRGDLHPAFGRADLCDCQCAGDPHARRPYPIGIRCPVYPYSRLGSRLGLSAGRRHQRPPGRATHRPDRLRTRRSRTPPGRLRRTRLRLGRHRPHRRPSVPWRGGRLPHPALARGDIDHPAGGRPTDPRRGNGHGGGGRGRISRRHGRRGLPDGAVSPERDESRMERKAMHDRGRLSGIRRDTAGPGKIRLRGSPPMKHDIRASRQWRAAAMTFSLLACPKISDADPYQCDIGNISVPHAVYDPTDSNPNSSGVGTVGITCHLKNAKQTQQVQYTIALSRGSSGSYNPRRMSGGRGSLGYNLYLDAGRG